MESAIAYIDKTIIGGIKIKNINFLKNFFFAFFSFGIGLERYKKIDIGYEKTKHTKAQIRRILIIGDDCEASSDC